MPSTQDVPASLAAVGTHDAVVLDGRTLGYATFGDPDGTPVFALHGVPGSRWFGALYHDAALDAGVCVVAPDRPGCGRSDDAPDRTVRGTVGGVAALADHLGHDRFGVLGFSAGAPHALTCASRLDRVTGTALVSPAGPPDGPAAPLFLRALQWLAANAPWLARPLGRLVVRQARGSDPATVAETYTASAARDVAVADGATAADVYCADFFTTFERGFDGFVRELRLLGEPWQLDYDAVGPVRCWHGSADENSPLGVGRALADRLPDCSLTVRDGEDHGEVPVRTRDAVLDALA